MVTAKSSGGIASTHIRGSIEAPATIQSHGILVVLRDPELTVEQISANVEAHLGIAAAAICGGPLARLMRAPDAAALEAALRATHVSTANPCTIALVTADGADLRFEGTAVRSDGRVLLELEPADTATAAPAYGDAQVPIERLQSAADITALVGAAARDIREISGFDNVTISRLLDDGESDVVAEAAAPGDAARFMGRHFTAADVPVNARDGYGQSLLYAIADIDTPAVPIVATAGPADRPVDMSRAMLRSPSPQQVAYVRGMGYRATVVMPVVAQGRTWGFVACHHRTPRRLRYAARAICELLGHMLGWQLGVRIDAEQQRRRAREAELDAAIGACLDAADDLVTALANCSAELDELFAGHGVAVRLNGVFRSTGNAPRDDRAAAALAATLVPSRVPGDVGTSDTFAAPAAETGASAGGLCINLTESGGDFLLVVRPERVRSIFWGNRPRVGRDARSHARAPFEPWTQVMHGHSAQWTADDRRAAESLAKRILVRLQHLTQLHTDEITHANAHLEQRNAQAAALIELQDDVAAALPSRAAVLDVILQFAQRQTRAEGCGLATLEGDEFVYEAANGILASAVGLRVPHGREAGALSATNPTALSDADRSVCERFGVASALVVPIDISPTLHVALKVVSPRPAAFNENDIQTLKLAATNLLSALRAAQKFTALAAAELEQRTYARQLRALHAIASTTTSHRKEQIDAALHLGLEQLGLDWAFLGVIDRTTHEFTIESSVSDDDVLVIPNGTRLPLEESTARSLATSKGVIIVNDVAKLADPTPYNGWHSAIAVPLFIGGANYGAIGFTSRDVRTEPFSEANIEFIAVAGELIASAIERGLQREQLEKSQGRYRALTEAIPQMMWVIDASNTIEYVNERWTQYTGLSLDDSRAAGRDGIFHPADLEAAALRVSEFDCEARLRRADGAYHWHLVRSVPFRGVAGDGDKWLVTATDIEARKSAETLLADVHDAALAATQAKSRFLATMSHEIRTPMNGVIGMTELLLLTPLNEEQREYTEVIRDSGQSLLRVLNDILDYSKIEAGKLELETVQFDLPGQVESVVELLRPGFNGKGVRLAMHIAPDVRTAVVGDPGRLRQILLNLAGNALKFTAAGGDVTMTVSTSHSDDESVSQVRFTLKDTGIGIPADVLDRLFQPFSQGDESTTRKYGGTGLGLSISAELVALMGGVIGVESVPDIGSEFWFVIPFQLAPNSQKIADARKRLPERSAPAPLRAERILLVEDNEINTFLALKQLQRLGFAVTAVTNGRQAVETVARERYDLLLMDCHMPEMDGFEATRAIRRSETDGTPHLPIVAMTADARDEDHQNCLLAGMDDYLSKPTNLDSLRTVLDRWLPAPERRRASRNGTSPLSSAPTLGMPMLLELFNGDRGAVLNLLTAALNSINGDLRRIEVALLERDFETVLEAAHRLKGTAGSIRSGRLAEIAALIEAEVRSNPPAMSAALHAELRAAVASVAAEIALQKKGAENGSLR